MSFSKWIILVWAITAGVAQAGDWERWRGPKGDGIAEEKNWKDHWEAPPPEVWKAQVGTGFSAVTVSKGKVFTLGNKDNKDTVYCLNAANGQTLWQQSYEARLEHKFFEGGPTSTPTVDNEVVYTLSRQGELFCWEVATGKKRWGKNVAEEAQVRVPGWGFGASPVVVGDLLLLSMGESGTAVKISTGELVWTSADRDAGYATPVLFQREKQPCAILASGNAYFAIDVATGEILWRQRWLTRFGCNAADPIVRGQQVWLSSGYNRGTALLDTAGEQPNVVWETKELQNQFSSSVLLGEFVYGFDGNTQDTETSLKCVVWKTGEVKWKYPWKGMGSLLAANGKLLALSEGGELFIAPASENEFKPTTQVSVIDGKCWTMPVLAHSQLYVRNADGDLKCFNLK